MKREKIFSWCLLDGLGYYVALQRADMQLFFFGCLDFSKDEDEGHNVQQLTHVLCHVSYVTCHVTPAPCHLSRHVF